MGYEHGKSKCQPLLQEVRCFRCGEGIANTILQGSWQAIAGRLCTGTVSHVKGGDMEVGTATGKGGLEESRR